MVHLVLGDTSTDIPVPFEWACVCMCVYMFMCVCMYGTQSFQIWAELGLPELVSYMLVEVG